MQQVISIFQGNEDETTHNISWFAAWLDGLDP
jgi:hypothetical protein